MCPVRVPNEKFSSIKQLLQIDLKLEVLERTPEQHDHEMAYVQGLSHYIGRVMDCMQIPESELATLAYEDLLDMKKIQGGDSWDLYASIMLQNPYAAEVNAQFKQACERLDEKLRSAQK